MAAKRRFGRVRSLPSGRYHARYLSPGGTDRPGPHTFATKRDAQVWLTLQEAQMKRGEWLDPSGGALPFSDSSRSLAQVPGDLLLDPILGLRRHDGAQQRGTLLVSGERVGGVDPERHTSNLGGGANNPGLRSPSGWKRTPSDRLIRWATRVRG